MMGNRIPVAVTKMLTLLPVLAAVYFFDFPKFRVIFNSAGLLAFFIVTMSLFLLGVFLKRRILKVRLEVSKVNFGWGMFLLSLAAFLYVYGSYTGEVAWFHYESLYVLIIAYAALRIGVGVLRSLAPLLAILVFSFLPIGFFPDTLHQDLIVVLSADLVFIFFLAFIGLRAIVAIVPLVMLTLATFAWYAFTAHLVSSYYLDALVPLPLLLLLFPQVRRVATLAPVALSSSRHEPRVLPNGFCSICGSKLSAARGSGEVGLWGMVAVLSVAALLLFPVVPVLALVGGVPHDAFYTAQGYSGTIIPLTPSGWQVNSTTPGPNMGNAYQVTQVYVPLYHPETKNYTVDYELSVNAPPVTTGPFGQERTGWNLSSNVYTQFGPFQGYLTTYVTPTAVMLAYHGVTRSLLVNSTGFAAYFVGIGFVREFKNSNVTSDASQFLADINALWLPSVKADLSYSGWTAFLYSLDQGLQSTGPFLITIASIAVMGWVVYRAGLADDRLDRFLTLASTQPEANWLCLSRLLKRPHHAATSEELSTDEGDAGAAGADNLDLSLRELERIHLVTNSLEERGADLVSVWRAAS